MQSIPLVNIVAAIHLFLIGGLATCGFIEIVFEHYALFFKKELHHSAIRFHHWIDIFVEIPLMIAVSVTGVILAFLVDELTTLHFIKIGCAICAVIGAFICFKETFRRSRMLQDKKPEAELLQSTKNMMVRNVLIVGTFTGIVFVTGLWLAYHRILESIYG